MSGLVRRRGYISRKVAFDGTAFLGGQSQLGLLAQFTILAHSSRRIDRCLLFGGFDGWSGLPVQRCCSKSEGSSRTGFL